MRNVYSLIHSVKTEQTQKVKEKDQELYAFNDLNLSTLPRSASAVKR